MSVYNPAWVTDWFSTHDPLWHQIIFQLTGPLGRWLFLWYNFQMHSNSTVIWPIPCLPLTYIVSKFMKDILTFWIISLGVGLTEADEINSGTPIHVVCPTQPIPWIFSCTKRTYQLTCWDRQAHYFIGNEFQQPNLLLHCNFDDRKFIPKLYFQKEISPETT